MFTPEHLPPNWGPGRGIRVQNLLISSKLHPDLNFQKDSMLQHTFSRASNSIANRTTTTKLTYIWVVIWSWLSILGEGFRNILGDPPLRAMDFDTTVLRAPWRDFDNFWFSEKFVIRSFSNWRFFFRRVTWQPRSGALKWKTRGFVMLFDQEDEVVGNALQSLWVAGNVLYG